MSRNVVRHYVPASLFAAVAVMAAAQPLIAQGQPSKKTATTRPQSDEPGHTQASVTIDLTPAIEMLLVTDHLVDDGVVVAPTKGNVFLSLTVRYDRDVAPQVFNKAMVRGRDARNFYGLRLLQARNGQVLAEQTTTDPIFERIELKSSDAALHQLSARNILGPRHDDKGKLKQEQATGTPKTLPASGWMALVFEVPKHGEVLKFQWAAGGDEEIDVEFVRQAFGPVPGTMRLDPSAPAVTANLLKLNSPSGAMAALAIRRLEWLRRHLEGDLPATWAAKVDAAVLAAADRKDEGVESAAWCYLSSYERLPEATQQQFAELKPRSLRRWAHIAKSKMDEDQRSNFSAGTQILCCVLRSDDASACKAALDALLGYGEEVDWDIAQGLSERAQLLLLARLESDEDQALASRLMTVLMKNARPATAARIASQADRLSLRLSTPAHPLLAKWQTLKSAKEKKSLLGVLGSVDLGDVIYSRRFVELIGEATASSAKGSVRDEAFRLLVRQALRFHRGGVFSESQAAEGDLAKRSGCFPTLVAPEMNDPVMKGLVQAATEGSRQTQIEALEALLVAGYAEQAERSLLGGLKDDAERSEALTTLFERKDTAGSYGLAAMLGRMLRKEQAASGPAILRQLDRMMEKVPPSERWQTYAAVKAGCRFDRLCELASVLEASDSPAALRWLYDLGHMTPQDRQRLAAASDLEDRLARLALIDHRRASLVDGQYGVIAIFEVIEAERLSEGEAAKNAAAQSASQANCRWRAPRHVTVVLPSLRIESIEQGDAYQVLWGKQAIGKGMTREANQPIRKPDAYGVRLVRPDEGLLGPGGWGWAAVGSPGKEPEYAVGPLILPADPPGSLSLRGTMTLDVSEYLQAALGGASKAEPDTKDTKPYLSAKYEIKLEYATFGSFCGSGERVSLATLKMRPGQRWLLNIALILERMD